MVRSATNELEKERKRRRWRDERKGIGRGRRRGRRSRRECPVYRRVEIKAASEPFLLF